MKLYSDVLELADLHAALPPHVELEAMRIRRPRVRSRGWDVRLSSATSNRHRNSGTHGAATWGDKAASYDDHGHWMAALYAIDPNMRVSYWKDRDDFERGTSGRYSAQGATT